MLTGWATSLKRLKQVAWLSTNFKSPLFVLNLFVNFIFINCLMQSACAGRRRQLLPVPYIITLSASKREKRNETVYGVRPSVCLSACLFVYPVGILTVTRQSSACDAASVHFGPTIRKTGILVKMAFLGLFVSYSLKVYDEKLSQRCFI